MNNQNLLNDLKILYVEDDSDIREQLGFFLKKKVGRLIVAKDGDEGLALYKKEKPDVVITDLKMPTMDGLQMSKAIREIDTKCSIIVTTAFSDVDQILKAVDVGISKYVIKPIDATDLLDAISDLAKINYISENDNTLIGQNVYKDRVELKAIENKIQKEIAHFIKTSTGKGPQFVKVMVRGQYIEVEAHGALTLMEKKLLEKRKNHQMVQFSREAFFNDCKNQLEELVTEIIQHPCRINNFKIDLKQNNDLMTFVIQ